MLQVSPCSSVVLPITGQWVKWCLCVCSPPKTPLCSSCLPWCLLVSYPANLFECDFFFFLGIETELSVLKCIYKKKNIYLYFLWKESRIVVTTPLGKTLGAFLPSSFLILCTLVVICLLGEHPLWPILWQCNECTVMQRIWFSENLGVFCFLFGTGGN